MNYHYLLLPIPFAFELYVDWWFITKGKKDVHILWRVALIAAVSLYVADYRYVTFSLGYLALACAPFTLFDPALNVLRYGWRKWYKPAKTKNWDKWLSGKNYLLSLIIRIILFVVMIVYWYNITFGR